MKILIKNLVIVAVFAIGSAASNAAPLYSGTVEGNFESPILTGFTIDPDGSSLTAWDNTATAVISGEGTNTFSWGAWSGRDIPIDNSTLSFSGAAFNDVRPFLTGTPGDVFELGTLTYTNGRSLFSTVAFGVTLTLSVDVGLAGTVTPAVIQLGLIQTETALSGEPTDNADFVTLAVDGIDIGTSFHIFEDATASVTLFGRIVGDPVLEFVDVDLSPGETGGFLRTSSVAEPASIVLLGLGLVGIGSRRHRSKKTS